MTQTTHDSARNRDFAAAARWTAAIAAFVCMFILTMLVLAVREEHRLQPLNSPELAAMKTQLLEVPNDEALKTKIRQRDEVLRRGFFSRQEFARHGGWLLVGAGAALVLAFKSYATLAKVPSPLLGDRPDPSEDNRMARWGVSVSAALIVGVAGTFAWWQRPQLPAGQPEMAVAQPPASDDELARNWVSFRGFAGDGLISGSVPEKWDGAKGEGIVWKTKVSLPGNSSPIVFGENLFLSASDGDTQSVFCFSTKTGELKWQGAVPRGTLQKPNVFEDTGFSAPTPCTDGVRVYAIFASGDIGAFDYTGRKLWSRSLGSIESQYGYAASLALYHGKLLVQWDHGSAEDGKSALICLDGATGKQVWKTPRPVANSWASPVVAGGRVYTCSNPWVIAYNAVDGSELWRAKLLEGDVAPSPVLNNGVLYVANDRAVAAAIKTDGTGDVSQTHVTWSAKEIALPDIVSPLTDGKYLLLTHGSGELNCLDAATGKVLWTHPMEAQMNASPILVGRNVYLFDKDGTCHLFELKDKFEELRANKLSEPVSASPAVVGGKLYIRARENLYCIQ
jgi:outer membrane protein assembly factor BamB